MKVAEVGRFAVFALTTSLLIVRVAVGQGLPTQAEIQIVIPSQPPPGHCAELTGIFGSGEGVYGYMSCGGIDQPMWPWIWTLSSGLVELPGLPQPVVVRTFPYEATRDGSLVFGSSYDGSSSQFLTWQRMRSGEWVPSPDPYLNLGYEMTDDGYGWIASRSVSSSPTGDWGRALIHHYANGSEIDLPNGFFPQSYILEYWDANDKADTVAFHMQHWKDGGLANRSTIWRRGTFHLFATLEIGGWFRIRKLTVGGESALGTFQQYPGGQYRSALWHESEGISIITPTTFPSTGNEDLSGNGQVGVGTRYFAGNYDPWIWTRRTGARRLVLTLINDYGMPWIYQGIAPVIRISDDGTTIAGRFADGIWMLRLPAIWDQNRSGNFDVADAAEFAECMSGPTVQLSGQNPCFDFDLDNDLRITVADFAGLQRYTNP